MTIVVRLMILILLLPATVYAADLKDLSEVRKFADSTMQLIGKGDIRGAFNSLKPYWAGVPDAEIEVAISKTLDQRKLVSSRFGRTLGAHFVDQQVVGDSVARLVYIEKYEKHIIRWQLYFYRPGDRWQFNTFNFDDQIGALFR